MDDSTRSKVLRVALYTLVALAYLSIRFWRPAYYIGEGVTPFLIVLMSAVVLVSLLSWNRHRIVAVLGLLVCFLWIVFSSSQVL
jgi:hypothetical protein